MPSSSPLPRRLLGLCLLAAMAPTPAAAHHPPGGGAAIGGGEPTSSISVPATAVSLTAGLAGLPEREEVWTVFGVGGSVALTPGFGLEASVPLLVGGEPGTPPRADLGSATFSVRARAAARRRLAPSLTFLGSVAAPSTRPAARVPKGSFATRLGLGIDGKAGVIRLGGAAGITAGVGPAASSLVDGALVLSIEPGSRFGLALSVRGTLAFVGPLHESALPLEIDVSVAATIALGDRVVLAPYLAGTPLSGFGRSVSGGLVASVLLPAPGRKEDASCSCEVPGEQIGH